jgi:hypothetical protein
MSDPTAPADGCFAAVDHRFAIDVTDPALAATLSEVFAGLRSTSAPDHRYALTADSLPTAIDALVAEVNAAAVRSTDGLAVHAAAVAGGGRSIVLHGPAGSGKTTLAAALASTGFDYVTDEVVAIAPDGTVSAYSKPLSLKPGSWPLLPDLDDATRLDGARARYVAAPAATADRTVPVAVLSLVQRPGPSELRPQRRADALAGLAASCFAGRPFGPAEADIATRVVAGATCGELLVGDLESAVALVTALLDPAAPCPA